MVYNVPSRTGVNIEPVTMTRICKFKNVVAIKEACGNISQIMELKHLLDLNHLNHIKLYSGDDGLTVPVLSIGGAGVISVLGNLMPKTMLKLVSEFNNVNLSQVNKYNNDLFPFYKSLFVESNPVPLKYLLSLKYQDDKYYNVRLPLVPLSESSKVELSLLHNYYYTKTEYHSELCFNKYETTENVE